MSLRQAYENGRKAAAQHFKLSMALPANAPHSAGVSGAQAPAAAMPMTTPKMTTPTTAPIAAAAPKANLLG